jgi:hypothetical protein
MTRDLVRAACVIAVLTVAASLLVETRLRLAAIDLAHRAAATQQATPLPHAAAAPVVAVPPPPGPLARLGRATLGLADAALEVVR